MRCDRQSESQNLCITCNDLKGYYPLKNSILQESTSKVNNIYIECFNDTTKPTNYFLNSSEKYYEPCYETCARCDSRGDKNNNNCLECDFGFIPDKYNNSNCIVKCPYYFYYTNYGQYKCSKLTICPEDYYLLIREKDQCIEDCKKDGEYNYQYNGECYKECPDNSSDNNDFICLDNNINICSLSKKEIIIKNEIITEEEIIKMVKSYVKEFSYNENHISLFNYSNYEIAIYKKYECVSELSLEIPSVNLGDCYEKIKKEYNISENLILSVISQRIKGINYPIIVNFYVFSPDKGNKLDIINICENEKLNVQEDISMKIEDKEKYDLVQYLTQQNIDVFNLSSDFYNDICYFFESPIKKDIALKDRIKLFYPNITLCENGCSIKGINSTTMKADCECKMNNLINNKNLLMNNAWYRSQVHEIEEWLSESNIEIMKCGSSLFKHRNITSFVGSLIILSLIIAQISIVVVYFIFNIKPFKKYIFDLLNTYLSYKKNEDNSSPPKKEKRKIIKNVGQPNKTNQKEFKLINSESIDSNIKDLNSNKNIFVNSNDSSKKSNLINNNTKDIVVFELSDQQNKNEIKKNDNELKGRNKLALKIENDINMENFLETEFDDMAFEEVKERDKRTFNEYIIEQIKSNLLIVNIILKNNPFKPRTLKILLFIINIDLYLFINALFINEEFISDVFHSKDNNFFSFLPRAIDRIFYTTLVKVIVNYIVDFFFIEEKKIKIILKSKLNSKEDIIIKLKQISDKALRRYIYFIIFSFIISLFCLYYITCFNYRYYYITNEWIKSSVFIIIFMEVLSHLAILIQTSLRFLSFKFSSEKIYKLSLIYE